MYLLHNYNLPQNGECCDWDVKVMSQVVSEPETLETLGSGSGGLWGHQSEDKLSNGASNRRWTLLTPSPSEGSLSKYLTQP